MNNVQEYREKYQCGIFEAHKVLLGEELTQDISDATNIDDLRSILRRMVDYTYPKRPNYP